MRPGLRVVLCFVVLPCVAAEPSRDSITNEFAVLQEDLAVATHHRISRNVRYGEEYSLVSATNDGYWIVVPVEAGAYDMAFLPKRDQLLNETADWHSDYVAIKPRVRAIIESRDIPLRRGAAYRIVDASTNRLTVLYYEKDGIAITLDLPRDKCRISKIASPALSVLGGKTALPDSSPPALKTREPAGRKAAPAVISCLGSFTKQQFDQQCGRPVATPEWSGGERYDYETNGIGIEAYFYQGRPAVDRIVYEVPGKFTEDQLGKLLEINSEGGTWTLAASEKNFSGGEGDTRAMRFRNSRGGEAALRTVALNHTERLDLRSAWAVQEEQRGHSP